MNLNPSVKELHCENKSDESLPQQYHTRNSNEIIVEERIPAIDLSLLRSENSDERSRIIEDLGNACEEWGCFSVVNHDVPESLQMAMLKAVQDFFDLTAEEKQVYANNKLFDPVRCGTGFFLPGKENTQFWRDFVRVIVHPTFHYPAKPLNFRVASEDYARRARDLSIELLRALWECLGVSEISAVEEVLRLGECTQVLVNNSYPPCSQSELTLGIPPHSDGSLLSTILQSEDVSGLEVQHNGKWIPVEPTPNSLIVQVGDFLEILSNGKYKSVVHRAMLNSKSTRTSVVSLIGPPLETEIAPLPQFVDSANRPAAFRSITHKEHIELFKMHPMEKHVLDLIRLKTIQSNANFH